MKIGYARVSTSDQKFDLQIDALKKEGCEKIYKDVISGAKKDSRVLNDLLNNLRSGDILIVWKLDRLGRSIKQLINLVNHLDELNVGIKSINNPIDTTSPQGRLIFNIFASLAEFERELTIERTNAGLEAARARGKMGGRPKGLSNEAEKTAYAAETLYKEENLSVKDITNKLNISKSTFYKYLRHRKVKISNYRNGN